MQEWIVNLTEDNMTAVMTPRRQSVTLTNKESNSLVIKDTDNSIVATVFPWNSLYVRNGKETADKYSISSTESDSGFQVEILEKKTKLVRRLACRFTF